MEEKNTILTDEILDQVSGGAVGQAFEIICPKCLAKIDTTVQWLIAHKGEKIVCSNCKIELPIK